MEQSSTAILIAIIGAIGSIIIAIGTLVTAISTARRAAKRVELVALQGAIKTLGEENERMSARWQKVTGDMEELRDDNTKLRKRVKVLEEENDELRREVADWKEKYIALEKELIKLKAKKDTCNANPTT